VGGPPAVIGRLRGQLAQRTARVALLAAAADQHRGSTPDLSGTIEFETSFATLYLEQSDRVITPGLTAIGEWEPGLTAYFGANLSPGQVFVDLGAHVGYFTCLAARMVGPRGLVVAFEPSPRNYELLLGNVWRNGLTNVVCFPWAASDHNGFADLYLSDTNTGDNRLVGTGRSVSVRTVALDSLEVLHPPVDVIKADVQGAEEGAFRGAEQLIAASPDVLIVTEFSVAEATAAGSDPRALLDYYRSLGFGVRALHPEEKKVQELSDDEILAHCAGDGGTLHTNLLLSRSPR
jgi:FkbM family methyltransferase